jgi:hypothetical protein
MNEPEFRLVPIRELHIHEEIDEGHVRQLVEDIRRTGWVFEPLWVDGPTGVILNGHHRFRALQELGAASVPAWVFDYEDARVRLRRWRRGPSISKVEVRQRGREGRPFPKKTTRHHIDHDLPAHPTPLVALWPRTWLTRSRIGLLPVLPLESRAPHPAAERLPAPGGRRTHASPLRAPTPRT